MRRTLCEICGLVAVYAGDICQSCIRCEVAQTAAALEQIRQDDPVGYARWSYARQLRRARWIGPDGKRVLLLLSQS